MVYYYYEPVHDRMVYSNPPPPLSMVLLFMVLVTLDPETLNEKNSEIPKFFF